MKNKLSEIEINTWKTTYAQMNVLPGDFRVLSLTTLLQTLCSREDKNLEVIELLLDEGCHEFINKPLESPSEDDKKSGATTLLHKAVIACDYAMVKLLCRFYITNVNIKNNLGFSPLHYAAAHNFPHIAKRLIKNGAIVDNVCEDVTPLHLAAQNESLDALDVLLAAGADVFKKATGKYNNLTAMELVVIKNIFSPAAPIIELYQSLQMQKAKEDLMKDYQELVKEQGLLFEPALDEVAALRKEYQDLVRVNGLLFEPKFDEEKWTKALDLIEIASKEEPVLAKKIIVEHLHVQAERQNHKCVALILKRGGAAYVNEPLEYAEHQAHLKGTTMLHLAIERNNLPLVKLLCETPGIEVNKCNNNGTAPIHVAVYYGNPEIVACLLKHKADPELRLEGKTALHWAVEKEQAEIVDLLLAAKANLHAKIEGNERELSVIELAATLNFFSPCVAVLSKYQKMEEEKANEIGKAIAEEKNEDEDFEQIITKIGKPIAPALKAIELVAAVSKAVVVVDEAEKVSILPQYKKAAKRKLDDKIPSKPLNPLNRETLPRQAKNMRKSK